MTHLILNCTKFAVIFSLMIASFNGQAQKKVHIISNTLIDAPIEEVYSLIKDYERFPNWSPFLVSDPQQKNHVTGNNGELGSVFHWEGVEEKSLGYQSLSELKENEYAKMDCTVQKPFKANSTFEYFITETSNGVEVRQEFKTEMGGFSHFMAKLFGMEKEIATTNQLGLDRLKTVLETELTSGL